MTSTDSDTEIQMECSSGEFVNASVKLAKPTNGALNHWRSVYWSRSSIAIQKPTRSGTTMTASMRTPPGRSIHSGRSRL